MSDHTRLGITASASAFFIWGLSPVYWKLLQHVPALELLAHRVVWALLVGVAWVVVRGRWRDLRQVAAERSTWMALVGSAACIAVNWLLFVWSVNNERVLDASLGYYINPLVSVLLGLVVLGERLNRRQTAAVVLAALGVGYFLASLGELPWVSLVLACSFGTYGLLRKVAPVNAVVGLVVECAILAPISLGYLVVIGAGGEGAFATQSLSVDGLLALSGPVTAVPLTLFAVGARRLPLSAVGLLQYIAPTCGLLLAVLLYHEPFTPTHMVTFALVWAGLALYTIDLNVRLRKLRCVEGA